MTVRELFREFKAAELASEDRLREATFQAWQTARFTLQGKTKKGMPTMKQALAEIGHGGTGARPAQTPLEARAAMEMIAAQHGLKIRTVPRG